MPTLKERFDNLNLKSELDKIREDVKTRIKSIDINEGVNKARVRANKLNDYALETTENTLDAIFTNGEKWNGVAAKAVNVGLKLSEKQMDLFFNTLEAIKGQMVDSTGRFRKLFKRENAE